MSNYLLRKFGWACVLAGLTGSVYGVDGVVLIDQPHSLAGNITPGDTPGFPVTISLPGSYRLSGNLTVSDANTTAIKITANDVIIDLNGFSIIGPIVCTGVTGPAVCPPAGTGNGIEVENNTGVKVLNGTVRGMGATGVFISSQSGYVERVTTESNGLGGMLVGGRVVDSEATLNGSFGIFAVSIHNSTAVNNHGNGIQVDASGGVAMGNISSFNGGVGFLLPNGTMIGNSAVRNGGFGISATCPAVMVDNIVIGNTGGIIQTNLSGCITTDNGTRQ
jgi:hypothetical protein